LEEFSYWKVLAENEIVAVLNLRDDIKTPQVHPLTFLIGEFGSYNECPVVKALGDYFGCQTIGCLLDGPGVTGGQKSVIVFSKRNPEMQQFSLDVVMTVEVTGHLKWEKRGHADTHGSQFFVTNVEVVMGKAATMLFYDAIIGVVGGKSRFD
jgi:hypothetical protein